MNGKHLFSVSTPSAVRSRILRVAAGFIPVLSAYAAKMRVSLVRAEALESERLKARLGEMLLERELLEAKIAALEARDPRPLPRRRSRR